eukprot:ANDGO_03323.mRNA.1 Protein Hook homolog
MSVLRWVQTISNLSKPCNRVGDLADGIIFADILKAAAPSAFESLVVNRKAEENKILRTSNLRKIAKAVEDYLLDHERLRGDLMTFDFNAAGRDEDESVLLQLAGFILVVVLNSENKALFIQDIMNFDDQTQHDLMVSTQTALGTLERLEPTSPEHSGKQGSGAETPGTAFTDSAINVKSVDNRGASAAHTDLAFEIRGDFRSMENLRSENAKLKEEIEKLNGDLREAKVEFDHSKAENEKLKHQIAQQLDQITAVGRNVSQASLQDAERNAHVMEQLKKDVGERDAEIQGLKNRIAELSQAEIDRRTLQDRVDTLEGKVEEVQRLNVKINKLEELLEKAGDAGSRAERLEADYQMLLSEQTELERSAAELPVLRSTVETLRKEVAERDRKLKELEESRNRLLDDVDRVQKEATLLRTELAATHAGAAVSGASATATVAESAPSSAVAGSGSGSLAATMKINNLEQEVAKFKKMYTESQDRIRELELRPVVSASSESSSSASAANLAALENQVEELTAQLIAEQKKNKVLNDELYPLQLQVKDIAAFQQEVDTLRQKVNSMNSDRQTVVADAQNQQRIRNLEEELLHARARIASFETAVGDYESKLQTARRESSSHEHSKKSALEDVQLAIDFVERYAYETTLYRKLNGNVISTPGKAWLNQKRSQGARFPAPGASSPDAASPAHSARRP